MIDKPERHTMAESILLHLFPGMVIVFFYVMLVPVAEKYGLPNEFALYITDIVILVSLELGILMYIAKRKTGTYKIKSQIPLLEKSTIKEYCIFIPLMAVYALVISELLDPIEALIRDNVFSFVPAQYVLGKYDISTFFKDKLLLTGILGVIVNGIVAPFFEELYFRGYLLPRIKLSPLKAVVLNAVLFSVYHFYSPWYFFSRVLMMTPLYYWVMKKRNIRFSIIAHMIANVVTSVSYLLSVL